MAYELVSFELCPFVQRARVIMLSRGVEHKVNYIDLIDPPPWFFDLSPLGQLPLLRLNEDEALFESLAICEYLNEIHGLNIWSEDPKERALERAMVGVSSACLSDLTEALSSEQRSGLARARASLEEKWDWLNDVMDEREGPLYGGHTIAMPDAAFASVACQLNVVNDKLELIDVDDVEKVVDWFSALNEHPVISESIVANFDELFAKSIERRKSYAAELMAS